MSSLLAQSAELENFLEGQLSEAEECKGQVCNKQHSEDLFLPRFPDFNFIQSSAIASQLAAAFSLSSSLAHCNLKKLDFYYNRWTGLTAAEGV